MSVADQGSPAPSLRRLPFTIRFSPQLINQLLVLRDSPAHPGEISGLLFGLVEEGLAVAQEYRAFPEGASAGGAAERSTQDALLERLLTSSQKSADTAAVNLIGWYAVREDGGLTASDVTYHDWYFLRPNDIALILKPEGPSGVALEIYCRTANGLLTEEGYRLALVRLSTAPLESAVEVVPRPKIQDDFFMRAYELADKPDVKSSGWKGTLAVHYRKAFSFLRQVEDKAEPGAAAERAKQNRPTESKALASLQSANGIVPVVPTSVLLTTPPATASPIAPSSVSEKLLPVAPLSVWPSYAPKTVQADTGLSTATRATAAPPLLTTTSPRLEPSRPKPIWPTVMGVFLLTSALTFGLVYALQISDRLPRFLRLFSTQPTLGLKVEAQGDRLLVTWNRQHPMVEHARNGFLLIEDGERRRQLTLDASHVANGSILYHPHSDDVTFRLQVFEADGQQAAESMRVLDSTQTDATRGDPAKQDANHGAISEEPRRQSSLPQSSRPDGSTAGPPDSSGSLPRHHSEPIATPQNEASKRATDLRARSGKGTDGDGDVQASPEEQGAKTLDQADNPAMSSSSPALKMPPIPGTNSTPVTPSTEVGSETSKPAGDAVTNLVTPAALDYVPPRPTRQVLPNISLLSAGVLAQSAQLELLVMVDETGRVTDVKPVENGKRSNQAALGSAIVAARQWRFEPARLRGKAIASQHSIVFQFAPRPQ